LGFVSNSSSSSFIIVVKPTEKCPHCSRSDDILSDIEHSDNDSIIATGKVDIINYIKNSWDEADKVINMLSEINDENIIMIDVNKWGNVSTMIREGKYKNVKVVYEDAD